MPMSETTADILATEQELANKMYMEGYAKGKKDADDLALNMLVNFAGISMEDIIIYIVHNMAQPGTEPDAIPDTTATAHIRMQAYASIAKALFETSNQEFYNLVLDRTLGLNARGRHSLQRDAGAGAEPILDAPESPSATSIF